MNKIELRGNAVMNGDAWASYKYHDLAAHVACLDALVRVEMLYEVQLLDPDTARSMASALNHFADKADKYKEGK